ncbi:putative glycosyl transferase family 9 protein [Selenomonas ruminantium subsp. lactilytica TAM6421]|uniref:Putative glycosyl transferase family 9 protein n=1 Tax=Selenomonas ruminantium subsp. lactilytica (strain NBRC 103574 / TAM6421) TaxID=927704 RepID=I0GMU8_SELRL|nr:glycosyltransferase family 9 protein [Selenomonas ruminantium]BAL82085.1 putative glycosyl transferase family 9 protein [Selenomonas ruminantium subsp. lactilytica TAM6421]
MENKHGKKILILRLSAIGDVLHATPVARELKRLQPDAHITWLVSPPADKLLAENPYIDELLVWDRRPLDKAFAGFDLPTAYRELKKARTLLKARHFDLVLDIQGLFLTGILAILSGAKRRIGIHERHEGNPFFMSEMAPNIESPHKVRRYLSALMPLGFQQEDFTPGLTLQLPADMEGFAGKFWQEHAIDTAHPILMVTVRTTWPDKNWEPENFGLALRDLPEDVQIVFCGSPGEAEFIAAAQKQMNRPSLSIAGETNLIELAALLKSADLLLSCDTGPLHIADAVGCRTLSLWGPTQPDVYGPLTAGHEFIISPHECRRCLKTKCKYKTNACMKAITPEMVADRLKQALKNCSL